MGVGPDDQEAGEAQGLECLQTVDETDDYQSQVVALRRMRRLAAGVERQVTSGQFGNG